MAAPDMDVIKEIPGYKVILKAVLKSQIQQLVEQLASHTDEESVILTASVSDGTLSHLGSDSGKFFLQDHEDIKSQFLGFCLKRHHRKKQEKDREEELQRLQFSPRHMAAQPSRYPPARQGVHPVSLARASPGSHVRSPGARHEPYSVPRPRRSLNQNLSNQSPADSPKTMTLPTNNQVIKIEPQDEGSNQSAGDINNQRQSEKSSSPPSSPLHGQGSIVKTDNADESSTSATANEASELPFSETQPAEGLGLDSDLSNLISGEQSVKTPTTSSGQTSEIDPDVNVKLESISESDMELEITGVEPGPGSVSSQDTSWAQNTSMGYDSSGATGNQADLQGQEGFRLSEIENLPLLPTTYLLPSISSGSHMFEASMLEGPPGQGRSGSTVGRGSSQSKSRQDRSKSSDYKPFECHVCGFKCSRKDNLKTHIFVRHYMKDK